MSIHATKLRARPAICSNPRPIRDHRLVSCTDTRPVRPLAFTLVELLVVIVVLAVLIALIAGVSTHVVHNQKVNSTKVILRDLKLACEEFRDKDPLRIIYNSKTNASFGPFPPYQLRDATTNTADNANMIANALEPYSAANLPPKTLRQRFGRDFLNNTTPNNTLVALQPDYPGNGDHENDDIRALYTYLQSSVPTAVARIPAQFVKPLPNDAGSSLPNGEFLTTASTSTTNANARMQISGFYDAWGVPLDYFLYAKVEWTVDANYPNGHLIVTDRKPVIRSRGIDRDIYEARIRDKTAAQMIPGDDKKWLFSDDFPSPGATATWLNWLTGRVIQTNPTPAGWVRVPGVAETFGYYPDSVQDR